MKAHKKAAAEVTTHSRPTAGRTPKIRVFLVDDHSLVKRGLRELLEKEADIELVGDATNATALAAVQSLKPDVVIVDISLRGMTGLDVIKQLAYDPRMRLIALDLNSESNYATRAIRCGAKGYLTSEIDESLAKAVRKVHAGGLFVSNDVAQLMVATLAQVAGTPNPVDDPMGNLSDRELEMAEMVGKGLQVSDIAKQMDISIKTVETHKAHMKKKLGISKGSQLTRFCVEWYAGRKSSRPQHA